MYESRKFAIFSTSEIDKIDFSQVYQTSKETLRISCDGTKTLIKWDQPEKDLTPFIGINAQTGEEELITPEPSSPPSFIEELTTLEGVYDYQEILEILSTPEWYPVEESVNQFSQQLDEQSTEDPEENLQIEQIEEG